MNAEEIERQRVQRLTLRSANAGSSSSSAPTPTNGPPPGLENSGRYSSASRRAPPPPPIDTTLPRKRIAPTEYQPVQRPTGPAPTDLESEAYLNATTQLKAFLPDFYTPAELTANITNKFKATSTAFPDFFPKVETYELLGHSSKVQTLVVKIQRRFANRIAVVPIICPTPFHKNARSHIIRFYETNTAPGHTIQTIVPLGDDFNRSSVTSTFLHLKSSPNARTNVSHINFYVLTDLNNHIVVEQFYKQEADMLKAVNCTHPPLTIDIEHPASRWTIISNAQKRTREEAENLNANPALPAQQGGDAEMT